MPRSYNLVPVHEDEKVKPTLVTVVPHLVNGAYAVRFMQRTKTVTARKKIKLKQLVSTKGNVTSEEQERIQNWHLVSGASNIACKKQVYFPMRQKQSLKSTFWISRNVGRDYLSLCKTLGIGTTDPAVRNWKTQEGKKTHHSCVQFTLHADCRREGEREGVAWITGFTYSEKPISQNGLIHWPILIFCNMRSANWSASSEADNSYFC